MRSYLLLVALSGCRQSINSGAIQSIDSCREEAMRDVSRTIVACPTLKIYIKADGKLSLSPR